MTEETKRTVMQLRLSDEDKHRLDILAVLAGVSMSEWVRRQINTAFEQFADEQDPIKAYGNPTRGKPA